MTLKNIVPVDNNQYVVKTTKDLVSLSQVAHVGSRALCLEDNKVYIYMDTGEWESV